MAASASAPTPPASGSSWTPAVLKTVNGAAPRTAAPATASGATSSAALLPEHRAIRAPDEEPLADAPRGYVGSYAPRGYVGSYSARPPTPREASSRWGSA